MNLIGRYCNAGFEAVADAVTEFYGRREDLRRAGVAFGAQGDNEPAVKRILTEMDTLTFPVWLVAQPDFKTRARVQLVYRYLADELRLVLNNDHV